MKLKNRPLIGYILLFLALLGSLFLFFFSEGFAENIMVELIGAIIFLLIIDQLLLKSERKQWQVVKNEIEYLLARTLNSLRDDILIKMFNFKHETEFNNNITETEKLIRKEKEEYLNDLVARDDEEIARMIDNNYLNKLNSYDDFFLEKAEDLWRTINNKYSDHFEPEEIKEFISLSLYLRDLNHGLKTYQKSFHYEDKKEYYQQKGLRNIVHNTREIIETLIELKDLGYQPTALFIEEDYE